MDQPRTSEEIISLVKRRLGGGKLNVEMTEDQFADAYSDSVRWFIGRKGQRKRLAVPVIEKKQEYTDWPDDIDTITNVIPPSFGLVEIVPYEYEALMLGIEGIPLNRLYIQPERYSSLVQQLQYSEMAKRVLSGDFSWEWDSYHKTLTIYPAPLASRHMIVEYISTSIDLRLLEIRELDVVIRRTLAEAKETLGRIRSKYSEIPMAGGDKSLDGDTLLGESQAEKDALDEEIEGLSYPVPFLVR